MRWAAGGYGGPSPHPSRQRVDFGHFGPKTTIFNRIFAVIRRCRDGGQRRTCRDFRENTSLDDRKPARVQFPIARRCMRARLVTLYNRKRRARTRSGYDAVDTMQWIRCSEYDPEWIRHKDSGCEHDITYDISFSQISQIEPNSRPDIVISKMINKLSPQLWGRLGDHF
jgi:hypothetical protein